MSQFLARYPVLVDSSTKALSPDQWDGGSHENRTICSRRGLTDESILTGKGEDPCASPPFS